jgi:hypothetical protein
MRTFILSILFLSPFLFAQETSVSFNTGDDDINQYLQEVDAYGKVEYQFFKNNLSLKFGVSLQDIDKYVQQDKISPGDLYYASAIASTLNKNADDLIALYNDKKDWIVIRDELGIQPESKEYYRIKSKTLSGIGKVKSRNMDNYRGKTTGKK